MGQRGRISEKFELKILKLYNSKRNKALREKSTDSQGLLLAQMTNIPSRTLDPPCRREALYLMHRNLTNGVWEVQASSEFMKRSTSEYI